jgi:hypothetical protein
MKTTLTKILYGAVLAFAVTALLAPAHTERTTSPRFSAEELARQTLERRAVDAAIWGMPIVSLDALRQAYFRDGKAKYGDIIWWPKGNAWKNQSLTPNTSVRYLYVFSNTKDDGPVVLDLPAAASGSSLLGTVVDAWQVPLTDVGFEGKGGKYLVLPPATGVRWRRAISPCAPRPTTPSRPSAPSWQATRKSMSERVTR